MSQHSQAVVPSAAIVWRVLGGQPGEETDPDKVKRKVQDLEHYYNNWYSKNEARMEFRDPAERKGYVYRYFLCNMKLTHCTLAYCPEIVKAVREILGKRDNSIFRVACIGGGPGSDMMGVISFLQEKFEREFRPQQLSFINYDACTLWRATWHSVLEEMVGGLHASFASMDVTSDAALDDVEQDEQFGKFDLYTMVRFCSELYLQRKVDIGKAERFFREVIKKAKPGAFFVLIDNQNPPRYVDPEDKSTSWLCRVARRLKLEEVRSKDVERYWQKDEEVLTAKEKASPLYRLWWKELGTKPQSDLTCLVRIWRKPFP